MAGSFDMDSARCRIAPWALLLLAGCVERTLLIRSDPPGAEIWVDGRYIGKSPTNVRFVWYGDHEIEVRMERYRSIRRVEPVPAPWYQIFPLDFVTDVLLPFPIRDEREFHFHLEPDPTMKRTEDVERRADELRRALDSAK